ncbi:MAG: DUF4373 domain-containing protein [Sphingobacteriales bacterium]|nr:MAG: DUF4373 domain-containing protein [Sphingobacteriales bacterium]
MKTKESQWFTHEVGTYNTPQMLELISNYGMAGYGNWWILMEVLRMEDDYKYDVSKPYSYNTISLAFRAPKEEVKVFIDDCINKFDLLQTDGEYIWSSSLLERMQYLEKKKKFYKERASKGGKATKEKRESQIQSGSASAVLEEQSSSATGVLDGRLGVLHDITLHNNTKHNNDDEKKTDPPSSPSNLFCKEVLLPIASLQQNVLAYDVYFVTPICMQHSITKVQLQQWLDAFSEKLHRHADTRKTTTDYRKHFMNWLRCYNPAKDNPARWEELVSRKKPAYTTPSPPANPTMAQLRAMRAAEEAEYEERKRRQRNTPS